MTITVYYHKTAPQRRATECATGVWTLVRYNYRSRHRQQSNHSDIYYLLAGIKRLPRRPFKYCKTHILKSFCLYYRKRQEPVIKDKYNPPGLFKAVSVGYLLSEIISLRGICTILCTIFRDLPLPDINFLS